MVVKAAIIFLAVMLLLALFGRALGARSRGRFCNHCGQLRPCGCRRGRS